jgi:hypothetical protein
MSRLLEGSEGFRYVYVSVRKDIPIENLARVAQVGSLRFVIDYYDVSAPPAENQWIYLERLESLLDLDPDDDRGFYEAEGYDVKARELFAELVDTEVKCHVKPMVKHFGENLESISVIAGVQYRLLEDEWEDRLEYLNGILPEELQLTMDELETIDSGCLAEYDPELHEAHRDDGTLFLQYFLDHETEGLAYLAFRILVHAIQNELEVCDIDDEPRWQRTIYSAGGEEEEDDDEDDEDDEDDDEEDED